MGRKRNQGHASQASVVSPLQGNLIASLKKEIDFMKSALAKRDGQIRNLEDQLKQRQDTMETLSRFARTLDARWHWVDDKGSEHPFDCKARPALEQAYQDNAAKGSVELQSGIHTYLIDFDSMTQTNTDTDKVRKIVRQSERDQQQGSTMDMIEALESRLQEVESIRIQRDAAQRKADTNCQAEKENGALKDQLCQVQMDLKDTESKLKATQMKADAACQAEEDNKRLKDDLCQSQKDLKAMLSKLEEVVKAKLAAEDDSKRFADCMKKVEQQSEMAKQLHPLIDLWRAPCLPLKYHMLEECANAEEEARDLLRQLSHQDQYVTLSLGKKTLSTCWEFQSLQIVSVQSVHNPDLWQKFLASKDTLRKKHVSLGVVNTTAVVPPSMKLKSLLGDLRLDADVNEVVLVHGCSHEAAHAIIKEGFDIRFADRGMYGGGIYFASQPCKSNQYTSTDDKNQHCMIIARVALGDPSFLKNRYDERLPPFRDDKDETRGRYDSNVVDPKMSACGQSHSEYVIFAGEQAYPEMLITYKLL